MKKSTHKIPICAQLCFGFLLFKSKSGHSPIDLGSCLLTYFAIQFVFVSKNVLIDVFYGTETKFYPILHVHNIKIQPFRHQLKFVAPLF